MSAPVPSRKIWVKDRGQASGASCCISDTAQLVSLAKCAVTGAPDPAVKKEDGGDADWVIGALRRDHAPNPDLLPIM